METKQIKQIADLSYKVATATDSHPRDVYEWMLKQPDATSKPLSELIDAWKKEL